MTAITAIHVAKKQLGLDDETARDVYERLTGKRSLREMSASDHQRVIEHFRAQGFTPASKGVRKGLQGKYAKKLQALWIAGWNLGVFRDRRDAALIAFVKRQTGVDAVRFVHDPQDAAKAIEGIKRWIEREAGPVWTGGTYGIEWRKRDGGRIAAAQWGILSSAERLPEPGGFLEFVRVAVGRHDLAHLNAVTDADWRIVMNALGELVRQKE